ncbi:hypothetical protein [uncultured Pontibacter sp.]|uniref:hypothetical protein n=1 Tax=uncultured Pontibacter sp. TaxID=453356 RepID=UPI002616EF8B|nr:hypothetical protein [uncultured Pontibacter sp.]
MINLIFREDKSILRSGDFGVDIEEKILFLDHKTNIDIWMDALIKTELSVCYTNIFIPTSFGDNVSDYLGLRLALHIRTTKGLNQDSNIYLYGPETLEEITSFCSLYQILLTEGVSLIDFSIETISKHLRNQKKLLNHSQLLRELKKILIDVPENYYDSHSISNVWGLYRLCEVSGIKADSIKTLKDQQEKLSHIYFKWLLAVNRIEDIRSQEVINAEQKYAERLPGLKILGKIELPANKRKR